MAKPIKPDGRKGRKNPASHFAKLAQTEEGRAQLAEWRKKKPTDVGRPQGLPKGWTLPLWRKANAQAEADAKEIVKYMEEKGYNIPKDAYAREGIETVVKLIRMEGLLPKDKLAAARTLLDFTMAKPAAETTVTVKKAEDFLSDLMTEMDAK